MGTVPAPRRQFTAGESAIDGIVTSPGADSDSPPLADRREEIVGQKVAFGVSRRPGGLSGAQPLQNVRVIKRSGDRIAMDQTTSFICGGSLSTARSRLI